MALPSGAKRFWLWPLGIAAVLLLQTALVLRHTAPGLDEWQALQIALQSPDLPALLENLRYEGHPPLWYLLLQVAALLVPTVWVLPAVQLPIALAIQSLVLARLPVSRVERLLLCCSFAMLIDYGMLARSLGLGVLLLLAPFLLRRNRLCWLPLALLPMADFLFGCLSLLLLTLFWREKRLWTPGIALWLVSALVAAWSVRPPSDISPAFAPSGVALDLAIEIARFGAVLLPLQMEGLRLEWNSAPPVMVAIPAGLFFLYMGVRLLWRDRWDTAMFAGFCALILLMSVAVYPLAIRHASLAGLLLLLLVARQREAGALRSPLFVGWLAVCAMCGLIAAAYSLARPFHAAPEAARYIAAHGLAGKHWASFPDSRGQGVSALLGIEFERLERDCTHSFVRWNVRSKISSMRDLHAELQRIAARSGTYYLLSDLPISDPRTGGTPDYQLLTHIAPGYDGQHFYLYQVRPDLPERGVAVAPCAPARIPLRWSSGS